MKSHARVVIIGGGAMGVSLLYHLCHLGWRDVVLVEKNELTAGSTWHAAGLCTHFAHNLTVMHMRAHSVRLYSGALEAETGQPVSFHQCGALRVTRSKDRMDEFRHVQGIGKFAGFDFNILSPDELKEIYPLCQTDDIIGAIHEPLDGYVDPSQATQAMALGARNLGAEIYRHTKVTAVHRNPSDEWLVTTDKGTIVAEHVVNAAGTWAWEVGRMMGLDLPVVPMLHQYLVTESIDDVDSLKCELPIIRDPEESWYVRQERDGLIIGPYERDGVVWSPDGVPPEFGMELLPPDLERVEHIVEAAMNRIPVLQSAGIKTIVNGPITFTPDAGPLVGPATGMDNAWLLTGSSMGVMEGGGAGKFLAEWMVSGDAPMDPLGIDSRRFGIFADRDYRLAKAVESFGNQFAIHYPYEERAAGRPVRIFPAYLRLRSQGAVFGSVNGWERPNWFALERMKTQADVSFRRCNWFEAVAQECRTVSEAVGLADLSVLSKFEVTGEGAEQFMEQLGSNAPPRKDGRIGLTHGLSSSGGVISEFTVTRLAANHFYLTSAAAARRVDMDLLRLHAKGIANVEVGDVTAERGVFALAGPQSRELLAGICDDDLSTTTLPWLSACRLQIAGIDVTLLRVSYAGESGFELHHDVHDQTHLYDALVDAGNAHDLGFFGAFALNSMRLEKGYRAWGMDLTSERTPLEAGLAGLVKTDGRDFTGRDAMIEKQRAGDGKRMVLLNVQGDDIDPFGSHPVFHDNQCCGMVTSGAYGHRTGLQLALAYLDNNASDDELSVEILGQRVPAIVLRAPPYDPEHKRLRNG